MYTFTSALIALSLSLVLCSISLRRAGWLDRVLEYQKKRFVDDLMKQHVQITARIEKAPSGYVDSKYWDYDSVTRLLTLIRESEGAAPVRQAFRRALKTKRRFLSFSETFKAFPSLIKDHRNDFYYDIDSGEYYADIAAPPKTWALDPNDVIVIANPVEAKLPSAKISVGLLKNILESRASAVRVMPTTTLNISWPVTFKSSTAKSTTTTTTSVVESTSESNAAEEVTTAAAVPQANDTSIASGGGGNETSVNETTTNHTETS